MTTGPVADIARIVHEEINKQADFKLNPVLPIELIIKNLNIWVEMKKGKPCRKHIVNKLILNSISCCFKAGTSTAILGSSGSGKTTLLNYISSRMEDAVLKSNGHLYINGESVSSIKPIKPRTGYVTQFDVVYPELTPKEQLLYSAKLAGVEDPESKTKEIIHALGLENCQDTYVGDDLNRGVSGGERKRTAVGIELITDPSLLFLDEPTTGLDSKSALDIAFIINKLARNGRTVISTIHSPSAEIMEQFDQVICLCRGEIIYYGPPKDISGYFAEIGFNAPPLTNPADHLMAIIHEDDIRIQALKTGTDVTDEEVHAKFQERIELFVATCRQANVEPTPVKDEPASFANVTQERVTKATAFSNFMILLGRCLILYQRSPQLFRMKMIQNLGFAAFALILLNKTVEPSTNTLQAILDRGGMAFNVGATMCFAGIFSNMYTFIPSLPVYRRESQNKFYGPLTYYFTHAFFEMPFHIVMTFVYQLIIYWVINIRRDTVWVFFQYFFVFSMAKLAASGVGDMLALFFKKIELVNQSFSMIVVPLFLVSGFAANIKSIPWHMRVYSYLSFFRFTFQGILEIEFEDEVANSWIANCRLQKQNCNDKSNPDCFIEFKNLPATVQRPAACNPRTYYDFYETKYGYDLLLLLGHAIFFRLIALWITYNFSKEHNLKNNDIPDDVRPQVEKRAQMKYSPVARTGSKPVKKIDQEFAQSEEKTPLNAVTPSQGQMSPSLRGPHGLPEHRQYQKPIDTENEPLA